MAGIKNLPCLDFAICFYLCFCVFVGNNFLYLTHEKIPHPTCLFINLAFKPDLL